MYHAILENCTPRWLNLIVEKLNNLTVIGYYINDMFELQKKSFFGLYKI